MAVELLLNTLRANANISTARSVYLMTHQMEKLANWWKEIRWEVMTHPDINRSVDIIE